MAKSIDNTEDIIDSRDVIARIADLEVYEGDEATPLDEDDAAELKALRALAEECEGYAADWQHGEALIRDSYFEAYARDLAEDLGAIQRDASWPNNFIDWPAAVQALQSDYTSVEFDGVTYWVR
jgi:hypothetical protein